ncbi:MAG: hypothetical protein WBB32_01495 [Flavobacteriales bacterium]
MTMKDHNEENELRKDAPMLFGIPKQDPFAVEEGFFERFPHEVQARVGTPQRAPIGIWLKRAAFALPVLALLVFGIHTFTGDTLPNRKPVASITISPEAAALYMASTDFDTPELIADVPTAEWPDLGTVTMQLSPDEALAYVDLENIDLTELIIIP